MKHIHANMDPLGRSAGAYTPTCIALLAAIAITGSAWPIYARSECPIVDIRVSAIAVSTTLPSSGRTALDGAS